MERQEWSDVPEVRRKRSIVRGGRKLRIRNACLSQLIVKYLVLKEKSGGG